MGGKGLILALPTFQNNGHVYDGENVKTNEHISCSIYTRGELSLQLEVLRIFS